MVENVWFIHISSLLLFSSKHEALLDNFKSSYFWDKGETIEVRFYKQIEGSYLSIKCLKPSLTVVFINATLMIFCRFLVGIQVWAQLRACLHGGEGPQVGNVTRLSIYSLVLIWLRLHDRWGDPPRRVARSARPRNPLSRGQILPCKRFKVR